jgi:hypothetical protein
MSNRKRKTKATKRSTERMHRVGIRLTPEDQALLAELCTMLPPPRSDASAVRYALRVATWLQRKHAAGGEISVTTDGKVETIVLGF